MIPEGLVERYHLALIQDSIKPDSQRPCGAETDCTFALFSDDSGLIYRGELFR